MNYKSMLAIAAIAFSFCSSYTFHVQAAPEAPTTAPAPAVNVVRGMATDLTITNIATGAPISGAYIYQLPLTASPSFRFEGDTCYANVKAELLGQTDEKGHFRTAPVSGTANRLLIFAPGVDVYSRFLSSGQAVAYWKADIYPHHPNATKIVFQQ